jgi:hypothetical protein
VDGLRQLRKGTWCPCVRLIHTYSGALSGHRVSPPRRLTSLTNARVRSRILPAGVAFTCSGS